MKQKLIITLWKAQFKEQLPNNSLNCRLAYNNEGRDSKQKQNQKSIQWRQTFLFPLAKQQAPLRIDFVTLKKGQQIHFAKNIVAQNMSSAHAIMNIPVDAPTKGALPAKINIQDQDDNVIGKVFIEYEVLKTEVTYQVERQVDYIYLLKLSSFRVGFLRGLKKVPKFYLKMSYGNKVHREDFEFQSEGEYFYYNYPIKLQMNKEIDMQIEIQVRDLGSEMQSDNDSLKSGYLTGKKSDQSKRNTFQIGYDKISTTLDLNFKENTKEFKKMSLISPYKTLEREVGFIEFQVEAIFKTEQEKKAIKEQSMSPEKILQNPQSSRILKKRHQPNLQQSNGHIIVKTIMGRLELFNDEVIKHKDISLTLKLGKQMFESSILEKPGNQLIFIDEFTFKRTWEELIKFTINVHSDNDQPKQPLFQSSVNLRSLFELGKITGQKCKILNDQKQHVGELILEMEYQEEEKKSKQLVKDKTREPKLSPEQKQAKILQEKRDKIAERMRQREEEKNKKEEKARIRSKSIQEEKEREVITMAQALDLKNFILPPLKSRNIVNPALSERRYSTISPPHHEIQKTKFKAANILNSNGGIKFSRSQRFQDKRDRVTDSFVFNRESDFDIRKKKGTFIGYGSKHDFTKDLRANPGIGKYEIPSLWDKYHI